MTAASAKRAALGLYIGLFFLYLFGPLLVLIALYARGGIDSLFGRRHD